MPQSPKANELPADLDQLMERIRAEVAARKAAEHAAATASSASTRGTDGMRARRPSTVAAKIKERLSCGAVARFFQRLAEKIRNIRHLPRDLRQAQEQIAAIEQAARETDTATKEIRTNYHREIDTRTQAMGRQATADLAALGERLDNALRAAGQEIADIQHRVHAAEQHSREAMGRLDAVDQRLGSLNHWAVETNAQMDGRVAEMRANLFEHWRLLVEQKLRFEAILRDAERNGPAMQAQDLADRLRIEKAHLLDAFYLSFEDHFRGTREEIKQRQSVYLDKITSCAIATGRAAVIDIGCGRGEWLELLGASGNTAHGYDLNRIAVEESRARGVDARLGDAIEALRETPDSSISAVTGFHIIEHLPFDTLVELIDHCLRVLQPGGILIFETPNPANLLVAAERFYLDPTHRNPLPSELTSFLLKSRGFDRVEVMPLHPVEWPSRRSYDDPMLALLQEKLFGPQDYSVLGWKAL